MGVLPMAIGADVLNSRPVVSLRDMYVAEYAVLARASGKNSVPAVLNALGACAGFAAQVAVWRELILPANRNPGDFLVLAQIKSGDIFFFGEAINQFLFTTGPDRLSFLSLAASTLSRASDCPDIRELARHVAQTIGDQGGSFGKPRLPPFIDVPELPQAALARIWTRVAQILENCRPAEWPALLGAAAHIIIQANRVLMPPPLALRILLEAALPMSKINPATVQGTGIPAPSLENWSMRALQAEHSETVIAEARAAMPALPQAMPPVILHPRIAFVNLAGDSCAAMAAADCAAIGGLFDGNVQVTTAAVSCSVLFLYCHFEPSGKIVGQQRAVRSLIRDSMAQVAVIASEVPTDFLSNPAFKSALAKGDNPSINLVVTLNRNGEHFGHFFKSLFQMMWKGESMPIAWVELAPQGPVQPDDIPATICLMEAGQVSFAPSRRKTRFGAMRSGGA
jgi:hypothetical protein